MNSLKGLVLGFIFVFAICGDALATTVQVGNCKSGFVNFTTINAAITASPNGTTILVCPGTYPEQVMINKPITIRGVSNLGADAAIIVPPSGGMVPNTSSLAPGNRPVAAQVLASQIPVVLGAVNISNITVDGNNNGITGCDPDFIGIYYQNASGTVNHVAAVNQILTSNLAGCQSGLGIFVQSDGTGGSSIVTVSNSHVQNYQKNGITGNEVGTNVTFSGNSVYGQGPSPVIAGNAIQLGFGATGKIKGNTAMDNVFTPATFAATGVLVFDAPNVTASGNIVGNNQLGIAFVSNSPGGADNGIITSNKVSATRMFDGIDVCSNFSSVSGNTINGSDEAAVNLDSSCGSTGNNNTVTSNTINDACAGILEGPGTSGNTDTPNTMFNVGTTILAGSSCTPALARTKARHFKPVRP